LACGALTQPQRYMALIAKGDEVLDWREMHGRYANCHTTVLEGGDHAITDFENHVPAICSFLGLR